MSGVLDSLRDIYGWWGRQMRALLPAWLLPDARQPDALLVALDTTRDASPMRLALRQHRREVPLGHFRLDATGQQAANAAIRQRIRRVVVRLESTGLLERTVVLPLAAERDVASVLRYEMDRLTPFTADQVYWSTQLQRRDRSAGRLELCLSLVPKTLLQPLMAALDGMGLTLSAIEATNRAGETRQIAISPGSPGHHAARGIAWGAVAALALVAVGMPFITQSLARGSVEARIAALQPQIAQVEALRRRIAAGSAGQDVIAAERARIGDALQVLAAVTELMPDDTVLSDLSLRQGKLGIGGRSLTAARLIPAMAADATMHNPSFAAPVTRTPDGKADTFVIRAELTP